LCRQIVTFVPFNHLPFSCFSILFFIITVFHFSTTEGISFFCDICRNLSRLLNIFYSKTGLNPKGERIIMGNKSKGGRYSWKNKRRRILLLQKILFWNVNVTLFSF